MIEDYIIIMQCISLEVQDNNRKEVIDVTRKVLCVLLVFLVVFSFAVPVGFAGETVDGTIDYMSQVDTDNKGEVTLDDVEAWIADIMISLIESIQRLSPIFTLFLLFVSGIVLGIGGIVGSKAMRGMGWSGILCSIAAYLIIRYATVLIKLIQDMAPGVGG